MRFFSGRKLFFWTNSIQTVEPIGQDYTTNSRGTMKSTVTAAPIPAAPVASAAVEIKASLYGVLHLTSAVGEAPFVTVGQAIEAGQTVAVIEAMKMFHPVKAKVAGKLAEILAQAGAEVAAGQALFRLD